MSNHSVPASNEDQSTTELNKVMINESSIDDLNLFISKTTIKRVGTSDADNNDV